MATGSHGQEVAQHSSERGLDFAARLRAAGDKSALLEVVENQTGGASVAELTRFASERPQVFGKARQDRVAVRTQP